MGSKLNSPQTSKHVGNNALNEKIQMPAVMKQMFLVVYNLLTTEKNPLDIDLQFTENSQRLLNHS